MGKKKQQLQPQPQPGAAAAAAAPFSLLLKGKPLWEPPSPHQQQRHEHMEGAETGSSSSGSGSSSSGGGSSSNGTAAGSSPAFSLHDGGNGRRPRHGPVSGAAASSRLGGEGEEGDAEITPESSPGSSNGDDAASSPLPPPLAPVGPTGAEAEAQAQQGALSPPPASPTPSLSLSELAGPLGSSSSSSSRRAAHEAALWSLLGAVKRGDGDGAVVDAGLLDRLLALGRLAFDPAACASGGGHGGSASPPRAGAAGVSLGWYARLLEAVAESELGAPPCALHRCVVWGVWVVLRDANESACLRLRPIYPDAHPNPPKSTPDTQGAHRGGLPVRRLLLPAQGEQRRGGRQRGAALSLTQGPAATAAAGAAAVGQPTWRRRRRRI